MEYDIEDIKKKLLNEKNQTEKASNEEKIIYYDNILKLIEKGFISKNYNTFNIDEGKDEIIKANKFIIALTTLENQRKNKDKNVTSIDLGEYEFLLRNFYNISKNETLYMKKIDIIQDGMKTVKVEFDVYRKFSGIHLEKLNLTICGKSKISLYIPIVMNEPLDTLNTNSGYYNDICYTSTSEHGTDIILKDWQRNFIDKDYIICQEDCDFSEYDYNTYIAKCSCNVKETPQSIADMNINKEKLLQNFVNIKNFANFNFLICYKKLFRKESIIYNIGSYIILSIILFHIISIFIFSIRSFTLIKKRIKNIDLRINLSHPVKKQLSKSIKNKNLNHREMFAHKTNKNRKKKKLNFDRNKSSMNNHINSKSKLTTNNKHKKNKNIINYIDEEINGLSYDLAIKYDHRTYCQYYISLIKTKHNLICALFNNNDYNSRIIKIDLFLIGFTIEYTINGLFYSDGTMHKIYQSKGQFDYETQIPIIVYSTLISYILNFALNFLALSNDSIINLKQDKTKNNIQNKVKKLVKTLTIKFTFYFIISFLFLAFFWYYLSMFGVIYKNTQIHLLKDILMSFGLSLFFPFIVYLIPGIFRIPALSNINNKRKCLYNFSKLLQ